MWKDVTPKQSEKVILTQKRLYIDFTLRNPTFYQQLLSAENIDRTIQVPAGMLQKPEYPKLLIFELWSILYDADITHMHHFIICYVVEKCIVDIYHRMRNEIYLVQKNYI